MGFPKAQQLMNERSRTRPWQWVSFAVSTDVGLLVQTFRHPLAQESSTVPGNSELSKSRRHWSPCAAIWEALGRPPGGHLISGDSSAGNLVCCSQKEGEWTLGGRSESQGRHPWDPSAGRSPPVPPPIHPQDMWTDSSCGQEDRICAPGWISQELLTSGRLEKPLL